ncbi:MAG TPA: DUF4192 domain-containing protein [Jatrophihabitans sp.]|uniref:DUF4192 domain-containing protein n=1 Tax=Jatrophihabitans sp. TaxID=1932789 RepID=UPI002EE6BE50
MTSCELPRIRISDPGELIETVPYLLGFHPRESLVLIGFAGGAEQQQIQVTVRLDLPDPAAGGLDAEALRPLGDVLRRADSEAMAAVLVTESVRGDPRACEELTACRDLVTVTMAAAGVEVLDVLVATGRRWWSLCCERFECCPGAGHQRVLGCSEAAAQATFAGLVALPDRQAMAATLAGRSAEQRAALLPRLAEAELARTESADAEPADAEPVDAEPVDAEPVEAEPVEAEPAKDGGAPEQAGRRQAQVAALLAAAAENQPDLSAERLAGHAVALTDLAVRDALWLAVDDGAAGVSRLMAELHTRLPPPYDAAPLFLFGWSQWRAGNATLAMMAAERVLESQPGYSAAVLLVTAAQRGLDPRTVPALSWGRSG